MKHRFPLPRTSIPGLRRTHMTEHPRTLQPVLRDCRISKRRRDRYTTYHWSNLRKATDANTSSCDTCLPLDSIRNLKSRNLRKQRRITNFINYISHRCVNSIIHSDKRFEFDHAAQHNCSRTSENVTCRHNTYIEFDAMQHETRSTKIGSILRTRQANGNRLKTRAFFRLPNIAFPSEKSNDSQRKRTPKIIYSYNLRK